MSTDEIAERLYSLPPEEFTAARNQAERELRKAGEREQAERVKALRKPSAAAGAVNRLVHSHRAEVETFLQAAARLREAQVAGKGDLAAASQAERKALTELVALGGESVRATLEAAAVDDDIARELLAARLVREPEPAGFGTLLAHAEPGTAKGRSPKPATARPRPRKDDSAARARLQRAQEALEAAAAEEQQARRHWEETQRDLKKAEAAVEKAQRKLDT